MWFSHGHHVVSMWTPRSMWLIFHHFYIISVANRSQKIANLWKPVTSLIMVWFSIREKFWKALGLYQPVVSISQISWDFSMKRDVRENSWCLWCQKIANLWKPVTSLTLILPTKIFDFSTCRQTAQKCLFIALSIPCQQSQNCTQPFPAVQPAKCIKSDV